MIDRNNKSFGIVFEYHFESLLMLILFALSTFTAHITASESYFSIIWPSKQTILNEIIIWPSDNADFEHLIGVFVKHYHRFVYESFI